MSKRVLAMALAILAFFIFVGSPFQQSANAIAVVDDALIAIIIAALAAIGISFVTTGAYNSLNDYVGSLFEDYAASQSVSPSALVSGVQYGTNKLGQLILNNRFVRLIQGFADYLKITLGLVDNDSKTVVSANDSIDGIEIYSLPLRIARVNNGGHIEFSVITSSVPCYMIFYWENNSNRFYRAVAFSKGPGQINIRTEGTINQSGNHYLSNDYSTYYIYDNSMNVEVYPNSMYVVHSYSVGHGLIYGNAEGEVVRGDVDIVINTGDIELPFEDENYNDGDGAIVDVGADWGDTLNDVVGDVIPNDFSDSKEGEATIEYVGEEDAASQVEDTPAQSISQEVSDYQTPGLQSVFPFCIPFDIYAFFECLAADPVAPSFTWRFYIPGICDEDIEIDLAEFDSAARILRTMELLLFIVGLAFVTRDKFLRG